MARRRNEERRAGTAARGMCAASLTLQVSFLVLEATNGGATSQRRVGTCVLSTAFLQERLRLLKVYGVKPLGEPAIDRGQQRVRLGALALLLPQPTQAQRGTQLQHPGLLAAGHVQGLVQTGGRLGEIGAREAEKQLPLEPRHFRCPPALLGRLHPCHGLREAGQPGLGSARLAIRLGQQGQLIGTVQLLPEALHLLPSLRDLRHAGGRVPLHGQGPSLHDLALGHAVHRLDQVAALRKDWSAQARTRWRTHQRRLLMQGEVAQVITAVRDLCRGRNSKAIRKHREYFIKNQHRMAYAQLMALKLPIGSGAIESAVRRVVNLRLKGPSLFWCRASAEAILLLRSYYKAGRWNMLKRMATSHLALLAA